MNDRGRIAMPLEVAAAMVLPAGLFLTGATALASEVVFNRLLRYVFGSSHEATATVLAAYMTGLSLGAYVFGRLSSRIRRKIAGYAYLELAVALLYVLAPSAYQAFRELGVGASRALSDDSAGLLTATRFLLSFGFVVVPTFFMGGTLPLLVAATGSDAALKTVLPRLYSANTMGAAFGTLLSAYLLIGVLGLDGTLAFCAVANMLVALVALALSARLEAAPGPGAAPLEAPTPESTAGDESEALPAAVIAALALAQGGVAFMLEVVWTHMIGTVIGVTVYAFATMLAAILLGIGIGSALVPRLQRRLGLGPLRLFVASEALLAVCLALALPLWDRFPSLINLTLAIKPSWGFAEREAVRLLYCLGLLVPAAACLGAALPALAGAASTRIAPGRVVGALFAANTLGAILGSLITGFVLLGRVSSEHLLAGPALLALGIAFAAEHFAKGPLPARARMALLAGTLASLAACAFPGWERLRLTAGTHYYWTAWPSPEEPPGELEYFVEDAQSGFVTVERNPRTGTRTLKTNGKYEASDAQGEFQDYLSIIGALYLERVETAFLLGLGAGRTLAILHEMPFDRIDVAEFSPAIVRAARERFPGFSGPLSDLARVKVHVDDGRNQLQMSTTRYDLVVIAISGAAFAGSGSIYNRDFYEQVRARLAPGGIFLLWQQLHHVPESETRSSLHTLRKVFRHVHFYAAPNGSQGFAIASSRPLAIRQGMIERMEALPRVQRAMGQVGLDRLEELVAWNVFGGDGALDSYLSRPTPVMYTDMYPGWEFETPRGLARRIAGLKLHDRASPGLPPFEPALEAGREAGLRGLRALVQGDARSAIELFERAEGLGFSRYHSRLEAARRELR